MSVTAARGFVAAGVHAGIKASGDLDLSLVATEDGAAVPSAGVFTSNLLTAPPVLVSRAHLDATGGRSAAVILNSGNANAATGDAGVAAAEAMCAATASQIGCAADEVLVCSTGLIGIPFPTNVVVAGVAPLAEVRSVAGSADAAEAIRTTDTHRKETVAEGSTFTLGGMAKGAAMLAPNMATMLAVLTTDAELESEELTTALQASVERSFNRLSVDGCTSTNDTVLVLASGKRGRPDPAEFVDALSAACLDLASQMARDAEGATKFVQLTVTGAESEADAEKAARRAAESLLVKCSWYGGKAYWGRVASELGSSGAAFDQTKVSVAYGGTVVCAGGVAVDHDVAAVDAHMAGNAIEVLCDLGLGEGSATILTNDLTHGYVDENMGDS